MPKNLQRRHASIMFTDIVGYTLLMGSDEDHAFRLLQKNRKIHKRLIKKYRGELIKEMGDGMLASFHLASNAVRCAQAIQFEADKQKIPLKIGIHQGEILFEGSDAFGDGVNIASRLQESSGEGSIAISGAVYNDVKNKPDIQTQFISEELFKNVAEPVKVYRASCDEQSVREFTPEKEHARRRSFFDKPFLNIGFVSVTVVAVIIFILFYGGTTLPFSERDWIVITDFENLTDEPIFDHSLNTAFMLSINQSQHINVISRQRMKEALKRMKKDDLEYIDEETGREIAMREGIKICIIPSISRVGTQYILTAKIQETGTGDILRSEVLYVEHKDGIIKKLDQLSKRTRRKLGESQYEILQQNKPLEKATTSSLDALKEYSLGIERHLEVDFEEARTHYENAIRIDSSFTAAKASLGNLLFEFFDREQGIEWLNQAILSIDNLTDKEKYSILAFHAVDVENDLDKGIEYTKTIIGLYPDEPKAHNNLGWYYNNKGLYENAVAEYRTTLQIDPYMMLTYSGIIRIYNDKLGQLDSVKKWSDKMIEIAPDNPWGYFYLGSYYVAKDQLEDASTEYLIAKDKNPSLIINLYRLAHVFRLLGKLDSAIKVLENILLINPEDNFVHYDLGVVYNLVNDTVSFKKHMLKFLEIAEKWKIKYSENPMSYIWLGCTLTRLGKPEEGWEIGRKAIELDSSAHFQIAQLKALQGKNKEAIDQLRLAFENGYRALDWLKLHPDFQSLHQEPNFKNLISLYIN